MWLEKSLGFGSILNESLLEFGELVWKLSFKKSILDAGGGMFMMTILLLRLF